MLSIHSISALLTAGVSTLGLGFIFVVAILDSTAFLGFFVPGQTFVLFLGGLTQTGILSWLHVVIIVSLGAMVGDSISYFFGRATSGNVSQIQNRHESEINIATRLLHRGLLPALILDRFVLPFRPIIPFMAGVSRIPTYRVLPIAFTLDIIFALTFTTAGYYIASGISLLAVAYNPQTVSFAISLSILVLFFVSARYVVKLTPPSAAELQTTLRQYKNIITENRFVKKYMHTFPVIWRRVGKLHSRLSQFEYSTVAGGLLITFLVFFILDTTIDIAWLGDPEVIATDNVVLAFLQQHQVGFFNTLFLWITQLGSTFVTVSIAFVTAVWLSLQGNRQSAYVLMTSLTGALLTTHAMKLLIARPRPEVAQIVEQTFAYPSGHATAAIVLGGFGMYLVVKYIKQWKTKVYLLHSLVAMTLLIGFSRLYLGVHYLSDVLVGYAIGASWLLLSVIFFHHRR